MYNNTPTRTPGAAIRTARNRARQATQQRHHTSLAARIRPRITEWIAAVVTAAIGSHWQPIEIGIAATGRANAAIVDHGVADLLSTRLPRPEPLAALSSTARVEDISTIARMKSPCGPAALALT